MLVNVNDNQKKFKLKKSNLMRNHGHSAVTVKQFETNRPK